MFIQKQTWVSASTTFLEIWTSRGLVRLWPLHKQAQTSWNFFLLLCDRSVFVGLFFNRHKTIFIFLCCFKVKTLTLSCSLTLSATWMTHVLDRSYTNHVETSTVLCLTVWTTRRCTWTDREPSYFTLLDRGYLQWNMCSLTLSATWTTRVLVLS